MSKVYGNIIYTYTPFTIGGNFVVKLARNILRPDELLLRESFLAGLHNKLQLYLDSSYRNSVFGEMYGRVLLNLIDDKMYKYYYNVSLKMLDYITQRAIDGYQPDMRDYINNLLIKVPTLRQEGVHNVYTWSDVNFVMPRRARQNRALDDLIRRLFASIGQNKRFTRLEFVVKGENEGIKATYGTDILGKEGRRVIFNNPTFTQSFMDGYDKYSPINTVTEIVMHVTDNTKGLFGQLYTDAIAYIGDGVSVRILVGGKLYALLDPQVSETKCIHNCVLAFIMLYAGRLEEFFCSKKNWKEAMGVLPRIV